MWDAVRPQGHRPIYALEEWMKKKRARSDACRPVARSVSSNAVISGPDLGKELSGKLCLITGYNDFVGPPPSAGQRKKKADA
ncbi:MAG: hypothetical protein J5838_05700, partial [Desulfovibrio sp.]|nr:hypothetical protein [Desulfovibrio sp.]